MNNSTTMYRLTLPDGTYRDYYVQGLAELYQRILNGSSVDLVEVPEQAVELDRLSA